MRQRLWNRSKLPSYTALCSHWFHKENLHQKVITKLTFRAPALCESEQRDWGLWVFNNDIIIVGGGGWGRWRRYAIGGKRVIFSQDSIHSDDLFQLMYHLHCSSLPSPPQRHHHVTGVSTEAGNPWISPPTSQIIADYFLC